MNFGIGDLLQAFEWVQVRRLKTVRQFTPRQPDDSPGRPRPVLESVSFYPKVEIGEPVPIVLLATNKGSNAASGGITVSFPTVARNTDGCFIETESSTPGRLVVHDAGGELLSSDRGCREVFVAQCVMRELQVSPWTRETLLPLRLKITPLREGVLPSYVTAWSATADWRVTRTPEVSEIVDQQNHRVFAFTIRVVHKK